MIEPWTSMNARGRAGGAGRWVMVALGFLLALLPIVGSAGQPQPQTDPATGALAWPEMDRMPAMHVEGEVYYAQIPPVGGPHNGVWQDCGLYTEPVYNWHAVHSLEHGAVWITYDPALPADQVATLQRWVDLGHVIVSPYPGLTDPVVASAWGRQMRLTGVGDPRLEQFVIAYRMSPETSPEPGAICSSGTAETVAPGTTLQTVPTVVTGTAEDVIAAGGTIPGAAPPQQAPPPEPTVDLRNHFPDRT